MGCKTGWEHSTVTACGKRYAVAPNTLVKAAADAPIDVVWTPGRGCDVLVVASAEFDSPVRVVARAAAPFVGGAFLLIGAAVVLFESVPMSGS